MAEGVKYKGGCTPDSAKVASPSLYPPVIPSSPTGRWFMPDVQETRAIWDIWGQ